MKLAKAKAARLRLLSLPTALLLAGAGALVVSCSQSDTVLLVHVIASTGPVDGIQQLHTTLRVGGQTHVIDVPDAPVAIALPTSFTVQLARSFTGELSVHVDARDATSTIIGSGTQTVSPLQVGQQNELTIDLAPGSAPDGGMDGPPDTMGTGGDTGSGGAAGTGGAVGTGGAAVGTGGGSAGVSGATGGSAGGSAGAGARGGGGGHAGTMGSGGGRPATGGTVGSGGTASGGRTGSGGMTASGGVPGSGGMASGGSAAGGDTGGGAGITGDTGGAGS